MLRVGLIGVGGMGGMHSECYKFLEAKGVTVAAVADLDKAKLDKAVKRHGARGYKTGLELIEKEDVDLIDICVPTYIHGIHALAAMDKKASVLIEKPVCLNKTEMNLLLKKQKETKANVAVAQCLRFWNEYEWLKNAVDKKIYGKVLSAVLTRLSALPWSPWYSDPEKSGSAALDLHIHDVDILRYLFGEPDKLSSLAVRDKKGTIQHIFTTYRFGSVVASAEGGWNYSAKFPFSMGYRINFEKGDAVFDSSRKPALMVYPKDKEPFAPEFKSVKAESKQGINISSLGAYYKELDYFTGRLIQGKKFDRSVLAEVTPSLELAFREIKLAGGVTVPANT
jgi:predicted dehydrogenase